MKMAPSSSYDHSQQLSCEIAIHQSKNVEDYMIMNKYYNKPHGNFFVRYYLSTGNNNNNNNNNKIQLQTREVPSTSHLSWNESISLDCLSNQDSFDALKTSNVIFELRWRSSARTNILGSKLVGRSELSWESVVESPSMEIEKWLVMSPTNGKRCDGVKPPSVKIGMRVRVPTSIEIEMKKKCSSEKKGYECGCCRHRGCHCADYDVLALVAAFEAI